MPANKNALLRYKVLDDCLRRRGRYWPLETLIEKVGKALREDGGPASVSKRTIIISFEQVPAYVGIT
jgi:predicted DNA-binding transcriptional regulator YafY